MSVTNHFAFLMGENIGLNNVIRSMQD